jgi:alkylhydroperoxidase family enzyme
VQSILAATGKPTAMEECMSTNPTVSRISLVDPENAPQPIKDALSRLPVINVFRALANAESLYPNFSAYMLQLFRPMELDKALERMIVLHVVKRSECLYAWRQNVVVGHSVGVSDEQIAALERGEIDAGCFDEAERAAFAFTNEVMDLIEATDGSFNEVKRHFSDRAIVEMLYVIGTYMMVARVLRTGRIPLDDKPADSPQ